jgi:hypothetical protein
MESPLSITLVTPEGNFLIILPETWLQDLITCSRASSFRLAALYNMFLTEILNVNFSVPSAIIFRGISELLSAFASEHDGELAYTALLASSYVSTMEINKLCI